MALTTSKQSPDDGDRTDVLVARTGDGRTKEVRHDAPMPATEPGHKGEELNPGPIFDPNAAYRNDQGRGPGLQDSERISPAHWVQQPTAGLIPGGADAYLAGLREERRGAEQSKDTDRVSEIDAEISRVEQIQRDQQRAAEKADPVTTKATDKA